MKERERTRETKRRQGEEHTLSKHETSVGDAPRQPVLFDPCGQQKAT